jgi:hypothetical protein
LKQNSRIVPIIDCRGDILEMEIAGEGRYLRRDCRLHGAELYQGHLIYLTNSALPNVVAYVQIFLSEDFIRGQEDRHAILEQIMTDTDKKAWLFSYAKREVRPAAVNEERS